jgi:hypothetical protein
MFHKRVVQHPLMQAFDGPDAQASCGRRENTTVAPQALALLNDKFVRARALDFAQKVENEAGAEPEAQVRLAWRLALDVNPQRTNWSPEQPLSTRRFGSARKREPVNRIAMRRTLPWQIFVRRFFALTNSSTWIEPLVAKRGVRSTVLLVPTVSTCRPQRLEPRHQRLFEQFPFPNQIKPTGFSLRASDPRNPRLY